MIPDLDTLGEQHKLLYCTDRLRFERQQSTTGVQLFERQVTVHYADLALGRGDMTRLKESITVNQH